MLVYYDITHSCIIYYFFFFNDTATTEIYTLSLHDALPILLALRRPGDQRRLRREGPRPPRSRRPAAVRRLLRQDRKSTRLNSSHANISYAVFCLKKKKVRKKKRQTNTIEKRHSIINKQSSS